MHEKKNMFPVTNEFFIASPMLNINTVRRSKRVIIFQVHYDVEHRSRNGRVVKSRKRVEYVVIHRILLTTRIHETASDVTARGFYYMQIVKFS